MALNFLSGLVKKAKDFGDTIGLDGQIGYQGSFNPKPPTIASRPSSSQQATIQNINQSTGFNQQGGDFGGPKLPPIAPPPSQTVSQPSQQIANNFQQQVQRTLLPPVVSQGIHVLDRATGVLQNLPVNRGADVAHSVINDNIQNPVGNFVANAAAFPLDIGQQIINAPHDISQGTQELAHTRQNAQGTIASVARVAAPLTLLAGPEALAAKSLVGRIAGGAAAGYGQGFVSALPTLNASNSTGEMLAEANKAGLVGGAFGGALPAAHAGSIRVAPYVKKAVDVANNESGSVTLAGTPGFIERAARGEKPQQHPDVLNGQPYYEFSDQGARIRKAAFTAARQVADGGSHKPLTVGDVLYNPEAQRANPELYKTPVKLDFLGDTVAGQYNTKTKGITLNTSYILAAEQDRAGGGGYYRHALETVIHEGTHAEQFRAGTVQPQYIVQVKRDSNGVADGESANGYSASPHEAEARNFARRGLDNSTDQLTKTPFYDTADVTNRQTKALMNKQDKALADGYQEDPLYSQTLHSQTDQPIDPRRTSEVVAGDIRATKPEKTTLERNIRVAKRQERELKKEITALKKDTRRPETQKAKMIANREAKITVKQAERAKHEAGYTDIKAQRRALGLEARRRGANPPGLDENQAAHLQEKQDQLDQLVYGNKIDGSIDALQTGTKEAGDLTKFTRKYLQDKPNESASRALSDGKTGQRGGVRVAQSLYGNFAKSEEQINARRGLKGGHAQADEMAHDIYHQGDALNTKAREKIYNYNDPTSGGKVVTEANLTKKQKVEADRIRAIHDTAHDMAYQLGLISKDTYEKNKGTYSTRRYDKYEFAPEVEASVKQAKNMVKIDRNLLQKRKGLTAQMEKDLIRDPYYAAQEHVAKIQHAKTVIDYASWASKQKDLVRDLGEGVTGESRNGFVKLSEHRSLGALAGKWVRHDVLEEIKGFHFANDYAQNLYRMANAWERFGPRQAVKRAKVVYNVGTRIANRLYNYGVAMINGINPVTFAIHERTARQMIKSNDPMVIELKRRGILGASVGRNEITTLAKELHHGEAEGNKALATILNIDQKAVDSYGLSDDGAKLATILAWTKRGYSLDESIRRATRSMQDYGSVGKAWDISAKIPFFGKAFGRFTGDFIRVAHNTAVDHPLRTASYLMVFEGLKQIASLGSNESPEDRKARENRLGAGKVPFTGQSTEIQTPWGAVDVRRFLGPSVVNDDSNSDFSSGLKAFSPFDTRNPVTGTVKDPNTGEKRPDWRGFNADPLLSPGLGAVTDQTFTGARVRDPNAYNNPQSASSDTQKTINVLRSLERGYAPPTVNDLEDTAHAFRGEPGYAQSQRLPAKQTVANPVDSAIRTATGIKVTQFGAPEAEKARSAKSYFDALSSGEQSLQTQDQRDKFKSYFNKNHTADGRNIQDSPLERINNNNNLFDDDKLRQTVADVEKKQGKHDPMWDLPGDQLKTFIQYQKQYTGDSAKAFIAQQNPWIKDVTQARNAYFDANQFDTSKQVKTGPQYPKIDDNTQGLLDQIDTLEPSQRGLFYKSHPEVIDAFSQISKYTNEMRKAEGAPELADRPVAAPGIQAVIDEYGNLPKGDGKHGGNASRSAWIQSNPDKWAAMTNYFTQNSVYTLAKHAALAQFKGGSLDQAALKSAYSLGQYSIQKQDDGTYTLGGGSTSGSGASGGGYKSSPNKQAKLAAHNLSRVRVRRPTAGRVKIAKTGIIKVGGRTSTAIPRGSTIRSSTRPG